VRASIEVSLRAFAVAILAVGLLGVPGVGEGQPPGRIYRIGLLHREAGPLPANDAAFQQGLRDLGYVPGQNASSNAGTRAVTSAGSTNWPQSWSGPAST
jgi:hypothetical protein